MFILIIFQMFLFNAFILYLRQKIKNEPSFVENPNIVPHIYVKRPLPPSPEFGLAFKLLQKGEVHCTVINLSVTCPSLVVLSVSQAYYSLWHDISKRLNLQIKYCRNPERHFVFSTISIVDVCVFAQVFSLLLLCKYELEQISSDTVYILFF